MYSDKINRCTNCGSPIYNLIDGHCPICNALCEDNDYHIICDFDDSGLFEYEGDEFEQW